MWARIFLSAVGVVYGVLAVWCSLDPTTTSKKVGFDLVSDSGRSEFLVVYGGLEFGLALAFLLPLWRTEYTEPMLWFCVILHGCLVLFRTVSFWVYPDTSVFTARLAIGEWAIFLAGCLVLWRFATPATNV